MTIVAFVQAVAANATVIAIAGWLAKLWADKRIESIKGDQSRQLEETKGAQSKQLEEVKGQLGKIGKLFETSLEKNMLVFRTHFELEFNHYKELWSDCDEATDLAFQTLAYYQRVAVTTEDADEEGENSIARYDQVRDVINRVRKQRPFIEKNIATSAVSLLNICMKVLGDYRDCYPRMKHRNSDFDREPVIREVNEELKEVRLKYDALADAISDRIKGMYVSDLAPSAD